MKYEDYKDKLEKEVLLTTMDDMVFRGVLYLGDSKYDTSSGEDEVEIFTGKAIVGIVESDIKSLEVL